MTMARLGSFVTGLLGAFVLAGIGACAPDDPGIDEDEADDAVADISNAKEITGAAQVVMLGWDHKLCTGSILSKRWILTAAHCVLGVKEKTMDIVWLNPQTKKRERLYADRSARYFAHPLATGQVGGNDFGLILLDEKGLATDWRMRIYDDEREPWVAGSTEDRTFHDVGWGQGSDPGNPDTCLPGTTGKKRATDDWTLRSTWLPWPTMVKADHPTQKICPGDSGSPWFFERGGRFLQFAVHSGGNDVENGALLAQKISWIEDASADAGAPLDCKVFVTSDGYRYRRCDDM